MNKEIHQIDDLYEEIIANFTLNVTCYLKTTFHGKRACLGLQVSLCSVQYKYGEGFRVKAYTESLAVVGNKIQVICHLG